MSDATKPPQGVSTDNETMDSVTKTCEYLLDDKALKKKLKKERQKDKKNHGKVKPECEPEVEVNKSEISHETESVDRKTVTNDDDNNDTNNTSRSDDNDESADINYSTMDSAFVQSIVNKNDTVKMLKKNDTVKGKDPFRDANHKSNTLFTDDSDGFTSIKKGGKQAPMNFCRTPEGFGSEALRVIREGNYELAINYLTRALALDQTDTRHYINRSYCYLRVGNYTQALTDIQYASAHFSDITEMSQAKCREGQAWCGLQNYEAAERAFNESINLAPGYMCAHREMKRMQLQQMGRMGFNERDALLALAKHPVTMDAINYLMERGPTNTNYDSTGSGTEDEDELFYSDSEDNPSNERLLSKMISYDPNMPEETKIHEPPPNVDIIKIPKQPPRAPSADRTLRVIKAMPVQTKAKKSSNQSINDKAVWVGSLTAAITDSMLQKRFGRFGKVTSVWKPLNENYAFVNFQCPTGPQKALEEARYNGGNIDLNGTKLTIKEATVKTFK